MAHECPECGYTCHCGGDIDDVCWGEEVACICCNECDEECEPLFCDEDAIADAFGYDGDQA